MSNLFNLGKRYALFVISLVCVAVLISGVFWALKFRHCYVFLTVEESSLNALSAWPLTFEKIPAVFIDGREKALRIPTKRNLWGVSLGVYYSASSQGVEFSDKLIFSRLGKVTLKLEEPISLKVASLNGELVEAVENDARVLRGNLSITKTLPNGAVCIQYGDTEFRLEPGQSWAEILVLTPNGKKIITPSNWEDEVNKYMEKGYPMTRLAIANRGLWPKEKVKVGMAK